MLIFYSAHHDIYKDNEVKVKLKWVHFLVGMHFPQFYLFLNFFSSFALFCQEPLKETTIILLLHAFPKRDAILYAYEPLNLLLKSPSFVVNLPYLAEINNAS